MLLLVLHLWLPLAYCAQINVTLTSEMYLLLVVTVWQEQF